MQTAELDEELAQQLKSQLITPLITLEITKWAVFGISLLLIFSACLRWVSRPKPERHDPESTDKMLQVDGISFNANNGTRIIRSEKELSKDKISAPLRPFLT